MKYEFIEESRFIFKKILIQAKHKIADSIFDEIIRYAQQDICNKTTIHKPTDIWNSSNVNIKGLPLITIEYSLSDQLVTFIDISWDYYIYEEL